MLRLIATDLDGTLLSGDPAAPGSTRVSARTLAALEAARDAGVTVVPASGRQAFSIADALSGTFLSEGLAIAANGAIGVHLGTGRTYFENLLAPDAQAALFHGLQARFPGVRCVSVRDGGTTFVPQRGYVGMMDPGDHGRPDVLPEFDLDAVLSAPSLTFVVRHPEVGVDDLLAAALELAVPGCLPTTSGAPFLEVSAAGVDKGAGLTELCGVLGIERADVVAFGDNRNDVTMLAWAGHGVAMGNALPEALAVADEVTARHDADGVAVVVERLLAGLA